MDPAPGGPGGPGGPGPGGPAARVGPVIRVDPGGHEPGGGHGGHGGRPWTRAGPADTDPGGPGRTLVGRVDRADLVDRAVTTRVDLANPADTIPVDPAVTSR